MTRVYLPPRPALIGEQQMAVCTLPCGCQMLVTLHREHIVLTCAKHGPPLWMREEHRNREGLGEEK